MMFAQVEFRPDPHLCFSPPISAPHPRNARTVAHLRSALAALGTIAQIRSHCLRKDSL